MKQKGEQISVSMNKFVSNKTIKNYVTKVQIGDNENRNVYLQRIQMASRPYEFSCGWLMCLIA